MGLYVIGLVMITTEDPSAHKTTDAKEAKKFMKEYLAKNPDRIPENKFIYARDRAKIFVSMQDKLIAVDPK